MLIKRIVLIVLTNVLILSCVLPVQNKEYEAYITGVELKPLDKEIIGESINTFHSDTLKNQICFEVWTKYELVEVNDQSLSKSKILLDPKSPNIINPSTGVCELRMNRSISLNEINFPAMTNILAHSPRLTWDDGILFPRYLYPFAVHNIRIDTSKAIIENGLYKIFASWENIDGTTHFDSIDVYIELGE